MKLRKHYYSAIPYRTKQCRTKVTKSFEHDENFVPFICTYKIVLIKICPKSVCKVDKLNLDNKNNIKISARPESSMFL